MVAALAKAIERARRAKTTGPPPEWPSWPERQGTTASDTATAEASSESSAEPGSGVDPVDGGCPDGYPVKVKEASGIFHVVGGRNYERTSPDRCYATAEAAEADGYRASKA